MLEVVIALLVLTEPLWSWDQLRDIETVPPDLSQRHESNLARAALSFLYPSMSTRAHPEMGLDDVRDFVVRGQVTEARGKRPLVVEEH